MKARTLLPFALTGGAVLLMGLGLSSRAGAAGPKPPTVPAELAPVPVDPAPGQFLPESGAREVWGTLVALDAKTGFGVAKLDGLEKAFSFRLLPYTSYRRYGVAGALPEEFGEGERVLLKLAPARVGAARRYLLEIRDEITEQVRQGQCYRMGAQDRDKYQFTAARFDTRANQPLPDPVTLGYGKGTFLVQREEPVYSFRVPAGTKLWINTVTREDGTRMVRETLDEASLKRFQEQQRLRLLARCETSGAPGYLVEAAAGGALVRLFPDYLFWSERLQPRSELGLEAAGGKKPLSVRFIRLRANAALDLEGSLPALKAHTPIRVRPAQREPSFTRDIRPLLEVNCRPCHTGGAAQSGFSILPGRLQAGGRRGAGIVPGKSAESLVYLLMSGAQNPRMPPDRDITPAQLALLKAWIEAGAKVDDAKPPQ